ncbi:uncharacterized protein [Parasteatoda tepidariorum]|uniref:uncharacterized protein isoform X2 n=1 Tax=Parasteatoda tepidariorum TaxID=114398 RepID=UPI001C72090A|nr:uncharacterized protein LOC107456716 isoform X2 [Parasteatoda tepidariorum]
MSDSESSPPLQKSSLPMLFETQNFGFQPQESKCVNSLCNLINTRLKLLENEIFGQHKVWEYIQKEVDEVKSLIEDCTSTCDSSSLSGHDNDSEVVDSALESHKTCNSLLWDKIKLAEENINVKKTLMKILSTDVTKLKSYKRKCKKKLEHSGSNIDLILEVTNGLNVFKCSQCKFCSDHSDFREALLSSIIELVHFNEKSHSSLLEENKAFKSCLQKIYFKTKHCLLHNQIYSKNQPSQHSSFENDGHAFYDNVYSSFEQFCHHFQSLQEELMQLKHILLAAEENHLDNFFQASHSFDCKSYIDMRKRQVGFQNEFEDNEKFSRHHQRNYCGFEKKLDSLRSGIFEAMRGIRDVEVEDNDDRNLINMVASLAEECGALRQEVSYLRNVRQEKKRSWNKLQCFIMDAERKLKGSRSISTLREIIRDLGQIIVSSESSSIDEAILYMYTNQLEWLEKFSMGCENLSVGKDLGCKDMVKDSENTKNNQECPALSDSYSQTLFNFVYDKQNGSTNDAKNVETCDVAIQVDAFSFGNTALSLYEPSFTEISREIYVVPEALDESDSCYNTISSEAVVNDVAQDELLPDNFNSIITVVNNLDCSSNCQMLVLSKDHSVTSKSYIPLSGAFPVASSNNIYKLPGVNFIKPTSETSKAFDISSLLNHLTWTEAFPLQNINAYLSLFLNDTSTMPFLLNNMFLSLFKNNVKGYELTRKSNSPVSFPKLSESGIPFSFDKSLKYLPYNFSQIEEIQDDYVFPEAASLAASDISIENNPNIVSEIITYENINDLGVSSTLPNESVFLPNCTEDEDSGLVDGSSIVSSSSSLEQKSSDDMSCETSPLKENFSLKRSGTFICDKPVSPCREGTFVIEPSEKLSTDKTQVFDKNVLFTAVLTAVYASSSQNSEKNYVLYEVYNSPKESVCGDLQAVNPCFETNFNSELMLSQHFLLCEASKETSAVSSHVHSPAISCYFILLKPNLEMDSKLFLDNISSENNAGSYPLIPQYLPIGNTNFESFEQFSFEQSCEIYMTNTEDLAKLENDSQLRNLIPKKYFKFKTSVPINDTNDNILQDEVLHETLFKQNLSPIFTAPYDSHSNVDLKIGNDNENFGSCTSRKPEFKKNFFEGCEKCIQTDNLTDDSLLYSKDNELQEIANVSNKDEVSLEKGFRVSHVYSVKDSNLVDEIEALKDNLNQQNAVLIRLKEDLDEANFRIAEKEQMLIMMQVEYNRTASILQENGLKEVEEKETQTQDDIKSSKYNNLVEEINFLKQKNAHHNEKIAHQNHTIQCIKSQLCSTISHLKYLKDAAAKQLKRQKHQHLKSLKVKQQLHDVKLELGKKYQELEKKNEILSDHEFQINEIQARFDSAIEELKQKSKIMNCEKVDSVCQTDSFFPHDCYEEDKHCHTSLHDLTLKKHSEELQELRAKFQNLEIVLSNKKEFQRPLNNVTDKPGNSEMKGYTSSKEGHVWKLLTISEQSYLTLVNKLSDSLQISDLKGSIALMHSSWLNCEELSDARRLDHKRILQSLEKIKKNLRYLQESISMDTKRQNVENVLVEEKKSTTMCHSEELHFQHLCHILQKAQDVIVKEYYQKRGSQRTPVTAGSGRTSRQMGSRERKIPLELKNGRILALLEDKLIQKEILPNKLEFGKADSKQGSASGKNKPTS